MVVKKVSVFLLEHHTYLGPRIHMISQENNFDPLGLSQDEDWGWFYHSFFDSTP